MRRLQVRLSDHMYILIYHSFYACYVPCSLYTLLYFRFSVSDAELKLRSA
jgi:hypothetical protein